MAIEGNQLKLAKYQHWVYFLFIQNNNQLVKPAKTILTSRPRNERNRFRRAIKLDFCGNDVSFPPTNLSFFTNHFVRLSQTESKVYEVSGHALRKVDTLCMNRMKGVRFRSFCKPSMYFAG